MSIPKLLRSSLLPAAVLALGLGFTLPASGAPTVFGPPPGGEGCSLVFTSPNEFFCVGPCSSGEACSSEVLVLQQMDGTQILRCGADCPISDCRTQWVVASDGELQTECRNLTCTSCVLDLNSQTCGCADQG